MTSIFMFCRKSDAFVSGPRKTRLLMADLCACTEHDGSGWEARITRTSRHGVWVHFLHARSANGQRYSEVELQLDGLLPI